MINEQIIFTLIYILLIGYISASGTDFIQFCIGDPHEGEVTGNRIFSKFGQWLLEKYEAHELNEKKRLRGKSPIEIIKLQRLNFYKALGVCPICFNVYFTFLVGLAFCLIFGTPFWYILPQIFVSNRFLRKIMEI